MMRAWECQEQWFTVQHWMDVTLHVAVLMMLLCASVAMLGWFVVMVDERLEHRRMWR
jgi:hypothetical protein